MAKGWTVVILIMILDVDVTAAGGIIKPIARKGDTTTLGPKGRCPPERSEYNPSTQPAAEPRPFFIICGGAATTTLGLKAPSNLRTLRPIGPVNLKNLPL